jgi:hypothetical protein
MLTVHFSKAHYESAAQLPLPLPKQKSVVQKELNAKLIGQLSAKQKLVQKQHSSSLSTDTCRQLLPILGMTTCEAGMASMLMLTVTCTINDQ